MSSFYCLVSGGFSTKNHLILCMVAFFNAGLRPAGAPGTI